MSTQHPITPPPELEEKWYLDYWSKCHAFKDVVKEIAQWGADQELEACIDVLSGQQEWDILSQCTGWKEFRDQSEEILRAARRPEPPSLNSIALQMLGTIEREGHYIPEITDTIRLALEALMTKQHRATPEQWETIEKYADSHQLHLRTLELRARIEALEAAQQPHQDKLDRLIAIDRDDSTENTAQHAPLFTAEEVARIVAPTFRADSLLDRVTWLIAKQFRESSPLTDCTPFGRAVILEVAAWLTENYARDVASPPPHQMLRNEANR